MGDTAFAAAVAAWGQRLKNDPAAAGFGPKEITALAGPQTNALRREFLGLAAGVPTAPEASDATPPPLPAIDAPGSWRAALLLAIMCAALMFLLARGRKQEPSRPARADGDPALRAVAAEAERVSTLIADPGTRAAVAGFIALLTRARALRKCDGDLVPEVEVTAERHAPGYLCDYAAARPHCRRAQGRGRGKAAKRARRTFRAAGRAF